MGKGGEEEETAWPQGKSVSKLNRCCNRKKRPPREDIRAEKISLDLHLPPKTGRRESPASMHLFSGKLCSASPLLSTSLLFSLSHGLAARRGGGQLRATILMLLAPTAPPAAGRKGLSVWSCMCAGRVRGCARESMEARDQRPCPCFSRAGKDKGFSLHDRPEQGVSAHNDDDPVPARPSRPARADRLRQGACPAAAGSLFSFSPACLGEERAIRTEFSRLF